MSFKNPSSYPIPKLEKKEASTQKLADPYKVIGVKNNDTLDTIHVAYKKLIMVLHPDKSLSAEAKKMGWSINDKNEAFKSVKDAYDQILILRKESDCPDYNIDYYINEELKIKLRDNDFSNYKQAGSVVGPAPSGSDFSSDKFNKTFELDKKAHEENGYIDPFSRGYDSFGRTSEAEAQSIMRSGSRPDIPVPKSKDQYKFDEPELNNEGHLITHVPKETSKFGLPTHNIPYTELGLTTVTDYSVKSIYKGGLYGTDLQSAYGTNNEYWEDINKKKDSDLFNKYNNKTGLDELMNKIKNERVDKYDFDPVLQEQLDRETEQERKLEEIRHQHQEQQDLYFDKMAVGRISYTDRTNRAINTAANSGLSEILAERERDVRPIQIQISGTSGQQLPPHLLPMATQSMSRR